MLQRIRDRITGWVAGLVLVVIGSAFVFWGIDFSFSGPTYADLGVKKHRAIRMQPRAGLVAREDREAYYQTPAESDDFQALIATGHEAPRRLAMAFCATARV